MVWRQTKSIYFYELSKQIVEQDLVYRYLIITSISSLFLICSIESILSSYLLTKSLDADRSSVYLNKTQLHAQVGTVKD